MRIFLSAGEASGDAFGAVLVREVKQFSDVPDLERFKSEILDLMKEGLNPLADFEWDGSFSETWEVDSLEDMEFLLDLEHRWNVKIDERDIVEWKTNLDVAKCMARRVSEVRGTTAKLTFEGIGGPRLRAEGVTIHADSSTWGAISIAQALRVYLRILGPFWRIKGLLKRGKPGLFVPIDFGYANIKLARHAKKCGWKVLYCMPPSSWRRDKQGKDLPLITDQIMTPFQWSAEILNQMGAKAHWFGHPIKQLMREANSGEAVRGETLAVLPGSRHHEIDMNLPIIAQAVGAQRGSWQGDLDPTAMRDNITLPNAAQPRQIEFALAPTVDLEEFKARWQSLAPGRDDLFTVGDAYGVLRRARAGVVCSGTATLEATLCRCPMVVIYQISRSMQREGKLLANLQGAKRPKYIALPNIILDKDVVPELAELEGVSIPLLRDWIEKLLDDESVRAAQMKDFEEIDRVLGPDDAITQAAKLALQMIE